MRVRNLYVKINCKIYLVYRLGIVAGVGHTVIFIQFIYGSIRLYGTDNYARRLYHCQ